MRKLLFPVLCLLFLALLLMPLAGCDSRTYGAGADEVGSVGASGSESDGGIGGNDSDGGSDSDSGNAGGELTIAAFMENRYLEFAAQKYEETHDGVKINITAYAGEERDIAKYSQIINTALMSDKGEDIIDVSYISWVKIADKNKLLDLSNEINLTSDAYYKSVMDAFLYNGKRYAIPMGFAFEAFQYGEVMADSENASDLTLDKLISLSERYPDTALFDGSGFGMGRVTLASQLFSIDFDDYVDYSNKKANIDGDKFISMLNDVRSIGDRLTIQKDGDVSLIRQLIVYSPVMCHRGTLDYTNMFLMTNANGDSNFMAGGFLPAVNANSNNKRLTIDFMKFLISEEIQSSPELSYCPVNKNAAAEAAKYILADTIAGGYELEGWGEDNLERNSAIFDELAGKLTLIEYSDNFIREFASEEMARFFQGEISAEDAAKNLQFRLDTYLNE